MESKKGVNFIFVLVAFILGMSLLRDFNFETVSFKKPALDILYLIAFVVAIIMIINGYRSKAVK